MALAPRVAAVFALLLVAGPAIAPALASSGSLGDAVIPTGIQARPLPDPYQPGGYGDSVALNDNATLLAVGAPREDVDTWHEGAVHVFERDTATDEWSYLARLTAPDPEPDGFYGSALAWGAGRLVVGAWGMGPGESSEGGLAFVYTLSTIRQGASTPETVLSNPESRERSFGTAVAFEGNRLAIGDVGAGRIYLYEFGGGAFALETIFGPTNSFGAEGAIALDDRFLAAGARTAQHGSLPDNAGAVFLYTHDAGNDTWIQVETLTAPTPERFGTFGTVDVDGDTLVVGEDGAGFDDTGRVHIYEAVSDDRENWTHEATFAPEGIDGELGHRVAVDGGTVLGAAPLERANLRGGGDERLTGAVYFYHRASNGSWEQFDMLRAPVPNADDLDGDGFDESFNNRFGRSLDLTSTHAAVGSWASDVHPETRDSTVLDFLLHGPEEVEVGRVTVLGPDPDRDHLATSWEKAVGTPPFDPDPDGDGLADGFEVVRWLSDPFDPDTDNDTLTDGFEAWTTKTQTRDPDTDGDLYSDAIETHGLTVEGVDVLAPSNPNDHDSVPAPLKPVRLPIFLVSGSADLSPTPPVDQPHHWPGFVEDQLADPLTGSLGGT